RRYRRIPRQRRANQGACRQILKPGIFGQEALPLGSLRFTEERQKTELIALADARQGSQPYVDLSRPGKKAIIAIYPRHARKRLRTRFERMTAFPTFKRIRICAELSDVPNDAPKAL